MEGLAPSRAEDRDRLAATIEMHSYDYRSWWSGIDNLIAEYFRILAVVTGSGKHSFRQRGSFLQRAVPLALGRI